MREVETSRTPQHYYCRTFFDCRPKLSVTAIDSQPPPPLRFPYFSERAYNTNFNAVVPTFPNREQDTPIDLPP